MGTIKLYPPSYEKEAKVAGWGHTEEGILSLRLKFVNQTVINRNECKRIWGLLLSRNAICGESKLGYPDRGDSGGALVIRGYIQIGIVSYAIPEISIELTVYTDVTKYITWIREMGDSGGALVISGYIQISIVSYGLPEISNELTVYTDVTKYITWMQETWDRLKSQ